MKLCNCRNGKIHLFQFFRFYNNSLYLLLSMPIQIGIWLNTKVRNIQFVNFSFAQKTTNEPSFVVIVVAGCWLLYISRIYIERDSWWEKNSAIQCVDFFHSLLLLAIHKPNLICSWSISLTKAHKQNQNRNKCLWIVRITKVTITFITIGWRLACSYLYSLQQQQQRRLLIWRSLSPPQQKCTWILFLFMKCFYAQEKMLFNFVTVSKIGVNCMICNVYDLYIFNSDFIHGKCASKWQNCFENLLKNHWMAKENLKNILRPSISINELDVP